MSSYRHTNTHIYIYMYICDHTQRERERETLPRVYMDDEKKDKVMKAAHLCTFMSMYVAVFEHKEKKKDKKRKRKRVCMCVSYLFKTANIHLLANLSILHKPISCEARSFHFDA